MPDGGREQDREEGDQGGRGRTGGHMLQDVRQEPYAHDRAAEETGERDEARDEAAPVAGGGVGGDGEEEQQVEQIHGARTLSVTENAH